MEETIVKSALISLTVTIVLLLPLINNMEHHQYTPSNSNNDPFTMKQLSYLIAHISNENNREITI